MRGNISTFRVPGQMCSIVQLIPIVVIILGFHAHGQVYTYFLNRKQTKHVSNKCESERSEKVIDVYELPVVTEDSWLFRRVLRVYCSNDASCVSYLHHSQTTNYIRAHHQGWSSLQFWYPRLLIHDHCIKRLFQALCRAQIKHTVQ